MLHDLGFQKKNQPDDADVWVHHERFKTDDEDETVLPSLEEIDAFQLLVTTIVPLKSQTHARSCSHTKVLEVYLPMALSLIAQSYQLLTRLQE